MRSVSVSGAVTWTYFGRVARQVWYIGIETEYRVAMYSKNTLVM